MNRHDRRAAQAKARRPAKNGISKIVAVHEAGHAVAKVLAAGELGYSINEAVKYIDMGTGESLHQSVDGKMMLRSQAVTFGPIFSRDINAASQQFREACLSEYKTTGAGPEEHLFRRKVVELGRAAGADIGKWFRARVFDAVSGSIAARSAAAASCRTPRPSLSASYPFQTSWKDRFDTMASAPRKWLPP